jgi:hypothetical protein
MPCLYIVTTIVIANAIAISTIPIAVTNILITNKIMVFDFKKKYRILKIF